MAGKREWVRVIAALALSALVAAGLCLSAAAAAGMAPAPGALPAKKKACKKKPRSSAAKKRKGCKKKKKTAPAGPTVRASMTWTPVTRDVDLHVFDASGAHAGNRIGLAPKESIPGTVHSYDVEGGGPETFTDQAVPSTRALTFYACYRTDVILDSNAFVTTRITDPGGATRVIGPQTLSTGGGQWGLIGVSPPTASAYAPPDPSIYCNTS